MPFTLAHPAAVLPFRQWWRQGFWGLIFGSMGPDLRYFLPSQFSLDEPNSHTLFGALSVGAPTALAVFSAMVLLRPFLIQPLWGRHRALVDRELAPFSESVGIWFHILPAIAIGSWIHILTDSITHAYGWPVRHLAFLSYELPPAFGRQVAVFHALQYLFSVAGIGLLVWFYRHELRQVPTQPNPDGRAWKVIALCVLLLLASTLGFQAMWLMRPLRPSIHDQSYFFLTVSVASFSVLYVTWGSLLKLWSLGRPANR